MERNWQQELRETLEHRFEGFCRALGQSVPPSGLGIVPPLAPDEAKNFVLGMEADLFDLDLEGYVQSPLLPPPSGGDTTDKMCRLFWANPPPPRLFREGVCQLATAAALILERGWLPRQIEIQPTIQEDGAIPDGVDILVKSIGGNLLACVEVKRSVQELEKLKRDLHQCCRRGMHPKDNCGFPQNHAKYEFCALHQPKYFWAVAPGGETCFQMNYHDDGMIDLDELPSLPPRSIVDR